MSDTRGFIQGVASLALTAVLVAGVPIFLITRFGWPFDDIINALTDQLASDATVVTTLLTATLVVVAWAAWIQITWAIAVEAVALVQGRSARRIPILPGFQQGAAQLVASCALVVSSFTPAAPAVGAPITPHQPAHDITLQVVADTPNNATDTAAARATSTAPEPRYTVTHGDTFWAIAERLLGDGLRWQEIRDLNLNHTMDDGTVITTATESPEPGWTLTLPTDATLPTTRTAQTDPIKPGDVDETHDVESGDNFWRIAEEALQEAWGRQPSSQEIVNYWHDVVEANTDRLQPPYDPNLIYPSQVFEVPEPPTDPESNPAPSTETTPAATSREVIVEHGDNFWRIAERTLQNAWERQPTSQEVTSYWYDVIDANAGRLQPPHDPNLIYPSQVLKLPAAPPDPTVATPSADTSPEANPETVDQSGVAAPDLGSEAPPPDHTLDPPEESELPLLHGLGDIEPPVDQRDDPAPALTGDAGSEIPLDIEDGPAVTQAAAPPVTQDQPSYTVPPTTVAPNATQDTPDQTQVDTNVGEDAPDDGRDQNGNALLPRGVTIAGLGILGASLVALLSRLRRRQLRQRKPGTAPTPPPPTATRVESTLRAAAAPDATRLIDLALRAMARDINAAGRRPPELVGVHLEPDKLRILLWAPHHDAPAGWEVEDDGRSWTLPTNADITQLHFLADTTPAPYPALVTVGHGDDSQLFIDLTFPGAVQLTGEPADVAATCCTMATELAASPFADTVQVVCVGFGHDLANLERIRVVDDLSEIGDLIDEHHAGAKREDPWPVVAQVDRMWRFSGQDRPDTLIVLDPRPTPPDGAIQLLSVALAVDGVAAVVGYPTAGRWRFHISDDTIRVDPLGYTLNRRNLTRNEQAAVADLITAAKDLDGVPETEFTPAEEPTDVTAALDPSVDIDAAASVVGDIQMWVTEEVLGAVPEPGHLRGVPAGQATVAAPAVDDAPTEEPTDGAPPEVKVLGTLRVTGLAERFEQAKCAELVTYLALHRHGTEPDTLMEAMWPEQPPSLQRLRTVVARARSALGKETDGEHYLPIIAKGELYRVSSEVSCDLDRFTRHVQAATSRPTDAQRHLRAALELVEGPPFSGAFNGYGWGHTKGIITHAIVTVDNAAHRLAKVALDANSPTLAVWAARQGLTATGVCEECYRNLMRCAIAENNQTALDATIDELTAVMDADDGPDAATYLEEETIELYEQHRRRRTNAD